MSPSQDRNGAPMTGIAFYVIIFTLIERSQNYEQLIN